VARRRLADVHALRFGQLGRTALRFVSALDASRAAPPHGPRTYVLAGGGVLPGWALSLLAAGLILPPLVASVDALARAGRRREPITRWLAWVWFGTLPFALGLGLADLLVLVGLAKDAPPTPLDPSLAAADGRALADLIAVSLTIIVAWVLLRTPVVRRGPKLPDASAPGAGVATALGLCVVAVATWFLNPVAALLFAIPLNCWMLAVLSGVRPASRAWLLVLGLLPLALVGATYMHELALGPLDALWYAFVLVTGGQVGVLMTLLACVVGGLFGATVAIVIARARTEVHEPAPAVPEPDRPAAIGPATRLEGAPVRGRRSLLRR
jgi:hypothetical protein